MTVTATQGYFYDRIDSNFVRHYASSVEAEINIHSNDFEQEPPDPTLKDTMESMKYDSANTDKAKGGILTVGRRSRSWHVWDCNMVSNNGQYSFQFNKINYTAEISSNIKMTPDTQNPTVYTKNNKMFMKSGYGVNLEVEPFIKVTQTHEGTGVTTTNTNFSPTSTSYVSAPQYVIARFREFQYLTYSRQLEKVNSKFVFKPNQFSTYNSRVHYTPWWIPCGTDYDMLVYSDFAYSPTGKLDRYEASNFIVIEGTLFDDWAISKSR